MVVPAPAWALMIRITSYNVCYTKLLRAINAGAHKNKYAASTKVFDGASSYYDITLTSLTEEDGESTYRLKVNGKLVGEFQNPETTADMQPFTHTFKNVLVLKDDVIQIESNTHSNGKIPEGDGFAFSRGRCVITSYSIHYTKLYEILL